MFKKILLVILAALMLFMTSFGVYSAKTEGLSEIDISAQKGIDADLSLAASTEGDLPVSLLKDMTLNEADRPEAVSRETTDKNEHVSRLYKQEEDLSTVVFQNRDGTKSLYMFDTPVKYIDQSGNIKDKSNALHPVDTDLKSMSEYAFCNTENNINTYFPKSIDGKSGVLLTSGSDYIKAIPVTEGKTVSEAEQKSIKTVENSYIEYKNVFDKYTGLRYLTTFDGFKEEIVLEKYTGRNEFSFRLETPGYTPACHEDGSILFYDKLTGKAMFKINPVIVYDSSGDEYNNRENTFTAENSMSVKETGEKGVYILTIAADKSFLESPDTVYPVYIDPEYYTLSSSNIQDVPIYSGRPSVNYGSNSANVVGYYGANSSGTNFSTSRMLLKIPNILNTPAINWNSTVNSVKLYMYEGRGAGNTSTINVYHYICGCWDESTAKYNNIVWSGYNTLVASKSVSTGGWADFNITSAYNRWVNGTQRADNGLMLLNSNESSKDYYKSFCSTEYSSTSLRPYVVIEYTTQTVPTSVTLSHSSYTIPLNGALHLQSTVNPSNVSQQVIWSANSSNVNIAPMPELNNTRASITANAPGTYQITVASALNSSIKATCNLTVSSLAFNQSSVTMGVGDTTTLSYSNYPSSDTIRFSSNNTSVATVNSTTGKVTAISTGQAKIKIYKYNDSSIYDECTVYVVNRSISLNSNYKELYILETFQLRATTTPSGSQVTWSSNDQSVASIDSNGLVTALGDGTAIITATLRNDSSKTATCTIRVSHKTKGSSTEGVVMYAYLDDFIAIPFACDYSLEWNVSYFNYQGYSHFVKHTIHTIVPTNSLSSLTNVSCGNGNVRYTINNGSEYFYSPNGCDDPLHSHLWGSSPPDAYKCSIWYTHNLSFTTNNVDVFVESYIFCPDAFLVLTHMINLSYSFRP